MQRGGKQGRFLLSCPAEQGLRQLHSSYDRSSWDTVPCSKALVPVNDFEPSSSSQKMTLSTGLNPGGLRIWSLGDAHDSIMSCLS